MISLRTSLMTAVLSLIVLTGCQTQQQINEEKVYNLFEEMEKHLGCQEGEISIEGTCTVAKTSLASTFDTDVSDQVLTETIAQETLKGYFVRPKVEGEYPGVVMIHEWWGLNDEVKKMADLLGSEGYNVFAIDLYNGDLATESEKARELSTSVRNNPEEALEKMKKAKDYLMNTANSTKIASLGWCFGGGQSFNLSTAENLDATVIYYGFVNNDPEQIQSIQGPVLGIFASEDQGIPPMVANDFRDALDAASIENMIHIYDNVGHAFANPSGSAYAQAEAEDAWNKTVDFLNNELK